MFTLCTMYTHDGGIMKCENGANQQKIAKHHVSANVVFLCCANQAKVQLALNL